ncbi:MULTISPECIES: alkaline phosphatase [unclassified Lentimonas]|uniref:alkaline phosphatase n=1 Tax=unclassified Lentimonas TaxID=2630993 RepID=UPI001328A3A9|nr:MULTISPECIES: alkaline phosphatase [unclassified Lentimonas]CAA6679841.1 Alkaline phosphatase (EC [Lentimonas sp. CC4]CAA6685646.1 Alkaline phosphatase (EC [Lentimonas sp. CC6]CAA7077090.1 Alkaline phosphatase (EC [Lentimonas sp. CC4]CAA7168829.1 Alkaline phosphatase (EC [Lentimonas sp. CC21]CAA7180808.1 Alkaline phosphatase (EC [Lentimonas sp. CC8]
MSKSFPLSNRRQFIKGLGLSGVAATLGASSSVAGRVRLRTPKTATAKNLIFLVVDGMCTGTYGFAHHWSLRNRKAPLNWMQVYEQAGLTRALQDTASASSPVTDSAAAASAWGCGQRVMNGALNTDANGNSLTPLFTYAKAAGKATGLVTTCRITHATPAGFATNVKKRGMESEIAQQYNEREIDVLLGGGSRFFEGKKALTTVPDFQKKGYQFVQTKSELAAQAGTPRLLGLFSKSHIPYAIDRQNDAALAEVPSLPQMFRAALKSLSQSKDGFVLQVEGGRVDHAGHGNDPAAILHELLEFDDCIPIALEYLNNDPDTLLIITTDHGTGGCQLNGAGKAYADSGPALERINDMTASFEALEQQFKATGRFDPQVFTEATGIIPTEAQANAIQATMDDPETTYLSSAMTGIVEDDLFQKTAVGWTSSNHTSECVDLFAFGPGSDRIKPFINNNELFGVMTQALDLKTP